MLRGKRKSNHLLQIPLNTQPAILDEEESVREVKKSYENFPSIIKKIEPKLKYNKLSKIFSKLSEPVAEKKSYMRVINENVSNIIKDTRKNARENFILGKKQIEIEKITNELVLYNNPSIFS